MTRLQHFLCLALVMSLAFSCQPQSSPEKTFAQSMAALPAQIHTKTFNLANFSNAVEPSLTGPSIAIRSATPAIERDLKDNDPEVRRTTMAVLIVLAGRRDAADLLLPFMAAINEAATRSDDPAHRAALAALGQLGPMAPDSSVVSLTMALNRQHSSENAPELIESLMRIRPSSGQIAIAVIVPLQDETLEPTLRIRCVYAAGQPYANERIVLELATLVRIASEKPLRDAAITAISHVGQQAAARVSVEIRRVAEDPSETPASRRNAHNALIVIYPDSGRTEVY